MEPGTPGQASRSQSPVASTQPPTADQIRDNVRNQVRNAINDARQGRSGDPQIIIPSDFRNAVPQGAVDISIAFFVTVAVIIVGTPIARAIARRMDRRTEGLAVRGDDFAPRMQQLQDSVDAMAIELERISESQRFQSKLLAGRTPDHEALNR